MFTVKIKMVMNWPYELRFNEKGMRIPLVKRCHTI
jgi:hypothetical protein